MYLHIVLMALTPDADEAFLARVQTHCDRVRQECAGVLGYQFRTNEAARSQGLDYATVSMFESAAAHDAYQVSDAHVAMKADMAPYIARLVVFDGDVAVSLPSPAA